MAPGGAAALSGEIKVGCQLHAVDGRCVREASTADTKRMILGAPGSLVTLLISDPLVPAASFEPAAAAPEAFPGLQCVRLQRNASATGVRSGVGVSFQKPANVVGPFAIVAVSDEGAAAKSGKIAVGDVLHGIGDVWVHPLETSQAVDLILGEPGSDVTLWVQPAPADPVNNDGNGSADGEACGKRGNDAGMHSMHESDEEVHSDEEDIHHTTKAGKYPCSAQHIQHNIFSTAYTQRSVVRVHDK